MIYPKTIISGFFNTDSECRQVNLHVGRCNWYWFVEPREKPYITKVFEVPMVFQFGQPSGANFTFHHFKIKKKGFEVNEPINLTGLIELNKYLQSATTR